MLHHQVCVVWCVVVWWWCVVVVVMSYTLKLYT